jgi:hypothetical protein
MGFWRRYYKKLLKKSAIWAIFYTLLLALGMTPYDNIFYLVGAYVSSFIIIFLLYSTYYYIKGIIKIKYKKIKKNVQGRKE